MISAATPSVPSDGDREPTVLVVEEDDAARSFLAENLEADDTDGITSASRSASSSASRSIVLGDPRISVVADRRGIRHGLFSVGRPRTEDWLQETGRVGRSDSTDGSIVRSLCDSTEG